MAVGEDSGDKIPRYVWRISLVVVIGSIMSILDTTIVNIALDTLGRRLHSSIATIQWVATAYLLALAAVIPVTGWAARRFGAKQVYIVSLVLFTGGSALCGLATSSTELIVFRVLQGIGGGMILPIGQLMMAEAAGPKRMGRVMSVVAVPAMLAPILGPTIGGLILENASWRWIFYVNLPIGLFGVIAALRVLPTVARQKTAPLDYLGFVLMAIGAPLVTYGVTEVGVTAGFTSVKVLIPFFAGLALVALFCRHALRFPRPLLNIRLYKRPSFSTASIAMFCIAGALFGGMILLPYYWQAVRHMSVVDTGLLTAPQGLGAALVMPLAGKLSDRLGGGPLSLFGTVLVALATIPFALIGAHTSVVWLCIAMMIRGFGIGFAFMPAMTAAFASLDRSELSDATPQLNVLQRFGGSMGIAILAVVLARASAGAHTLAAQAAAYGTAFWAATALTAVAIIPCVILMRSEGAARRARAEASAPSEDSLAEPVAA
jgi:EmrB/QacA subfamily drug resistance transporter